MALKSVFCHQDKTNARWITAFLPQHCKIILNISIFLCHFRKCFIYLQHASFCHLLDPLFHSFQPPLSLIQRRSCKCPLSGVIIDTLIAIQTLKNSQKRRKKMYQSKRKVVNVNNIAKPEILRCRILPTTIPVNLWHFVPKKKKSNSTFADFCRFKFQKARVPSSSTSLTVCNLCMMSTPDSIHPLTECHIIIPSVRHKWGLFPATRILLYTLKYLKTVTFP